MNNNNKGKSIDCIFVFLFVFFSFLFRVSICQLFAIGIVCTYRAHSRPVPFCFLHYCTARRCIHLGRQSRLLRNRRETHRQLFRTKHPQKPGSSSSITGKRRKQESVGENTAIWCLISTVRSSRSAAAYHEVLILGAF